jgi:uncharacterized membrane protein YphA (DoxX/SURF4 family)
MRDAGTVGQTSSTRTTRRRVPTMALWALQTLLAIMFAMAGLAKVFGDTRTGTTFALTKIRLAPNLDSAEHVTEIVRKAVADS